MYYFKRNIDIKYWFRCYGASKCFLKAFLSLIYLICFSICEIICLKCSRHIHIGIMFLQNYNLLCSGFCCTHTHTHIPWGIRNTLVKLNEFSPFLQAWPCFLLCMSFRHHQSTKFQVTSKGFLCSDQHWGACRMMRNEPTPEVQWKVKILASPQLLS